MVRRPAIDDARDRRLFDRIALRGLSEEQCPRQELDWIIQATRSSELPTILTVAGKPACAARKWSASSASTWT